MDHTLRLYSNPFKQSLYLLGSLGFVAVALLLLHDPKYSAGALNIVMAYLCIGFFGLGCIVFLYSMARDLLIRHPVIQVDTRGWTYYPAIGRHSQHVPWQDICRVAIYRQRVKSSRMFYLVLEARHPNDLPPSRTRAITASFYPSMPEAVMTVPLNTIYLRSSETKVERLLHNVQTEFSGELQSYGIMVDDKIMDM